MEMRGELAMWNDLCSLRRTRITLGCEAVSPSSVVRRPFPTSQLGSGDKRLIQKNATEEAELHFRKETYGDDETQIHQAPGELQGSGLTLLVSLNAAAKGTCLHSLR